jgi:hypothetical protein
MNEILEKISAFGVGVETVDMHFYKIVLKNNEFNLKTIFYSHLHPF